MSGTSPPDSAGSSLGGSHGAGSSAVRPSVRRGATFGAHSLVFVLSLGCGAAAAGQEIPSSLRTALQLDDRGAIVLELLRLVERPETRPQFLASVEACRAAGASELVLEALDRSLASRPDDPWQVYERGVLRRDLKFLRAARADLERAQALDPGSAALTRQRAFTATLAFDAAAAASLYREAGASAEAAPFQRLDEELGAAATRQWLGLAAVALVVLVPGFARWRRRRVGA